MSQQPKIELKNISTNSRLSEETLCYSAKLYVDGKFFAHVGNRGCGGCDEQHLAEGFTYADLKALNDRIGESYPEETYDLGQGKKGSYKKNLETICSEIVADHMTAKDLQKILKRTVAFVTLDNKLMTFPKIAPDQKPRYVEHARKTNPTAKILNDMPFAEALALYKKTA